MEWDEVRTFLAVSREGSVAGAASALGCNPSTVTRRLAQLEERLQVKLFERRKSGYRTTSAGETLRHEATAIEAQMVALAHRVSAEEQRPAGKVIFSAPAAVSGRLIVPHLSDFHARHPDIDLEIVDGDATLDVYRHEADVVLRATLNPPDQLLGRRLGVARNRPYASRAYLAERASSAAPHHFIVSDGPEDEGLRTWADSLPSARIVLRSAARELRARAAGSGLGICNLPESMGDAEPALVRVPGPVPTKDLEVWLLTHPDLRMTPRVRVFQAWLVTLFTRINPLTVVDVASRAS